MPGVYVRHCYPRLSHPPSGRVLEVYTDQPGVQFYTGNFLDIVGQGKGGASYPPHSGLCLETQNYPDAPNHVRTRNDIICFHACVDICIYHVVYVCLYVFAHPM